MRPLAPLVCLSLLAACAKSADPPPAPAPARAAPSTTTSAASPAAPLGWTDPPGWVREPPSNPMRLAQYTLPKADGDAEAPTCVINTFGAGQGGTVDANIDRWVRQFDPASAGAVEKQRRDIHGLSVTLVELSGTWRGMTIPGAAPAPAKPAQRMLGAIVEHPSGLHFFKLVGPDASVARAKPAFLAMLETLR